MPKLERVIRDKLYELMGTSSTKYRLREISSDISGEVKLHLQEWLESKKKKRVVVNKQYIYNQKILCYNKALDDRIKDLGHEAINASCKSPCKRKADHKKRVNDPCRWILSTIAVITMPIWIMPVLITGIFLHSVSSFKRYWFDKDDK